MNIGYLVDLIKADPTILDNQKEFISKMNEKNITVVTKVHTVVADKEEMFSLAERNGGELTQADIDYAVRLINQQPLKEYVDEKFKTVVDDIVSGEITDVDSVDIKIKEVSGK